MAVNVPEASLKASMRPLDASLATKMCPAPSAAMPQDTPLPLVVRPPPVTVDQELLLGR